MTVILADEQFIEYYGVTPGRSGVIATIPWATTGMLRISICQELQMLIGPAGVAQLCIGGTLASMVGRIWTMRLSLVVMIIGMYESFQTLHILDLCSNIAQCRPDYTKHLWRPYSRSSDNVSNTLVHLTMSKY